MNRPRVTAHEVYFVRLLKVLLGVTKYHTHLGVGMLRHPRLDAQHIGTHLEASYHAHAAIVQRICCVHPRSDKVIDNPRSEPVARPGSTENSGDQSYELPEAKIFEA